MSILLVFVGLAVVAGYAALHLGWFHSLWELALWLVVCVAFLAVGLPSQGGAKQGIAQSRWATRGDIIIDDITDNDESDNQFPYLGIFAGADRKGHEPLRYKGPRHLICFGPTRSGKSAAIITPNLQNLRRSIIVTDPKGELAAITASRRETFGRVLILNPFEILKDKIPRLASAGWNPMLQLDPDSHDFAGDAMCIADAIIDHAADGKSDFFIKRSKEFFRAFIMHERITKGTKANLYNISSTLSRDLMETIESMAKSDNKIVGDLGTEFARRKSDKSSQSTSLEDVIATIKSNIYFLDDPRVGADMYFGQAIDFAALHREIVTIYLILPVEKLDEQAKWLRLFVNLALVNLIRAARSDKAAAVPPVLFMLDEFGSLGRLEQIVKGLNMAASSRIQLFFFLQNVGQLEKFYKEEADSFGSGSGAAVAFQTGALDSKTAKFLSEAFGSREVMVRTANHQGESITPQASPLIRPEEIAGLKKGTAINIIEPCRWPIKVEAPIYIDTPFKEGLDPHPDHG